MKRIILLLTGILAIQLLSGQGFQPVTNCKELKEKIISVQKSFDKISDYKDKEIEKTSYSSTFTSKFDLCGNKSIIVETDYQITLTIKFSSADYKGDESDVGNSRRKVIDLVTELFGNWYHYNEGGFEDGALSKFYYFIEGGSDQSKAKNYLKMHSYTTEYYTGFTIEFIHRK